MIVIQAPGRESPVPRVPFSGRNLGFSLPEHDPGSRAAKPAGDHVWPTRSAICWWALAAWPPIARRTCSAAAASAPAFVFAATTERKNDRNVIGFFPGSDPEKKKEIDHLQRPLRSRGCGRQGRDLQRLGR